MKWVSTLLSKTSGLFNAVTTAFQGRSTVFAVFFTISATVLAAFGKLTDSYVHVIFAVQGYVLGHSIKEDYFKSGNNCAPSIAPDTNQ
jgi:hypothetical protein